MHPPAGLPVTQLQELQRSQRQAAGGLPQPADPMIEVAKETLTRPGEHLRRLD